MKPWFTVSNKADSGPVEILIYDQIGKDWFSGDGIAAKDFAESLQAIPKDREIVVGINSPGGNVWDGLAIYHQLKARADKVTTRIDGIAASIASVIALAGNKVQMPANALMMIHRAWGMAAGNAADLTKLAADLEKHDAVIASIYSARNKKSTQDNFDAMAAETWFTGSEAHAFGFVDEVTDAKTMAAAFDPSRFNFRNFPAPAGEHPSRESHDTTPVASAGTISAPTEAGGEGASAPQANNNTKGDNMSDPIPAPAAPTPAPALDLTPIVNAITDLKATLTAPKPGADPLPSRVENLGNPLVEKFNSEFDIVAKAKLAKNTYAELRKQLFAAQNIKDVAAASRFDFTHPGVMNANTVDAALANTVLSGEFVTTMRTYIAPWAAFTRTVSLSPVSRRQTLEVPLYSSAGSKQQNATNYETGDSVLAPIAVAVAEESKSFHVSRPEANLGLQLAGLIPTNTKVLAEGIHAKMTALMTNGNYGADNVIGAAASFDSADLPAILALGKNFDSCRLLLDGGHLAYLLPTTREHFAFGEPGAYGFDGGIYKNNLWTSAATDICGFVCGPDAIVNAWGAADGLPAGEAISQNTVDVNGIPFTISVWFSRASRAVWASMQVMHGCAVGDATQGKVLTTQ